MGSSAFLGIGGRVFELVCTASSLWLSSGSSTGGSSGSFSLGGVTTCCSSSLRLLEGSSAFGDWD